MPKGPSKGASKGTRRTTPSPETLAELGPERLIGLILGETARNPAFKKLVSAALAARQGPEAVAAMVDRRLAALEGARGFIDWQKRRSFAADLDATVTVILSELQPLDPEAALDRLTRFLAGADAVLNRVDDGSGQIAGLYERAAEAAVAIAAALPPETAGRFALGLVPRVAAEPVGIFAGLLRDLVARSEPDTLGDLDAALAAALAEAAPAPGGRARPAWEGRLGRAALLRIRQDIADRRGDVDAFIALEQEIMPEAPERVAIAERLVAAARAEEALDWLRRPGPARRPTTRADLIAGFAEAPGADAGRISVEIRALEALGRGQEAQDLRWARFADSLDAAILRDFLAKLPDFEDDEALDRAFARAEAFPDRHRALAFLVGWPDPERAARLVLAHPDAWDGTQYGVLAPAAEALAERHPRAATLLFRRLLDTILARGQSAAYAHAARYHLELDALAERLEPGAVVPEPDVYKAQLRRAHGRKYGFWSLIGGGGP